MHLQRLRIRTLETFDKLRRLGDKLLLLVIRLLLLHPAFLAQLQILRVIHFIVIDTPHRHLDGTRRDIIHKLAVVTNHNHRLTVIDQKIFQPLDRLDIQVIRRLIEQQHVRFLQQQLRQLDTHPPSTAEITRLTLEIRPLEPQSEQSLLHILLIIRGINRIKLLTQCRDFLNQCHITVALVIRPRLQLLVQPLDLRLHFVQMSECLCRFFKHRPPVFRHQVLRQIRHHAIFGSRNPAAGRLPRTRQNLQQCTFTSPVLAHQGDAVFLINYEGNVTK